MKTKSRKFIEVHRGPEIADTILLIYLRSGGILQLGCNIDCAREQLEGFQGRWKKEREETSEMTRVSLCIIGNEKAVAGIAFNTEDVIGISFSPLAFKLNASV